jgi:hypothetical protein
MSLLVIRPVATLALKCGRIHCNLSNDLTYKTDPLMI